MRAPARGEKRRLAELAAQNARLALDSEAVASEQKRLRRVAALEELREALNLESLPLRIECYDISNIQGQEIVGSMVVFQDGIAEEGALPQVRACAALDGQDDFASMAEVVSRRFARLGRRDRGRVRRGVRGGAEPGRDRRRQGSALGGARRDAGVRAAARRRDRAREAESRRSSCRAGRTRSCSIRTAPACNCSSGLGTRPTASRSPSTASGASARARESLFDTLEGVGPVRRRALLQHFGSTEGVLAASQEELEGVPGVPAKTARAIYAQLHRTAGRRPRARPRRLPASERQSTWPSVRNSAVKPRTMFVDDQRQLHPDAEREQRRPADDRCRRRRRR